MIMQHAKLLPTVDTIKSISQALLHRITVSFMVSRYSSTVYACSATTHAKFSIKGYRSSKSEIPKKSKSRKIGMATQIIKK